MGTYCSNCERKMWEENEDQLCTPCIELKKITAELERYKRALEWKNVDDGLPDTSRSVLVTYINSCGNRRRVKAFYARRFEIEGSIDSDEGVDEYCEERDEYYVREGWWEQIDNWSDYSFVAIHEGEVDYWMELPPSPDINK